ncbi:hypothetical protein G6F54_014467 [Rhizopus delemar]|nr:hypothetical protein G6F54_014467 [Rhizopus delemar]
MVRGALTTDGCRGSRAAHRTRRRAPGYGGGRPPWPVSSRGGRCPMLPGGASADAVGARRRSAGSERQESPA